MFVPTWQLKKNRRVRGELFISPHPPQLLQQHPAFPFSASLSVPSYFHLALPLMISIFCLSPPESHFLTKLHSLKMLSITPSQLENGKKITTYDYRCASPQAFSLWGSAGGLVCQVESCLICSVSEGAMSETLAHGLCAEGHSEERAPRSALPEARGTPDFGTLQLYLPS